MKEVLSIVVGENESSKYWLSVLNSLKNRGVQDILILCSDGLTGIKDAISTAFPKTEQQRCIVHMVRNTLKYVANKDMKAFAKDLKTIYTAADEEAARKQLESVTEKWSAQYPSAMNRWHENWDAISPIFKFSKEVRTAFYTTNVIESLNSCYRRLNKQRSIFPSSQALMKALYLGTFEIAKKWTMPIRNWGKVRGELETISVSNPAIRQFYLPGNHISYKFRKKIPDKVHLSVFPPSLQYLSTYTWYFHHQANQ